MPIIPRWEWRAFGAAFSGAEDALARSTSGPPHESDEIYFLASSGQNVKFRDGLMDVKVLKQVDRDGLEQWVPVMKAEFPLPAADVRTVLEALDVTEPQLRYGSYALAEFILEFARPGGPIRAVRVGKRRERCTIGSCRAEISDVEAFGYATRTLAVESEDPAAVIAAVRGLGLGDRVNTSYPKGLAALLAEGARAPRAEAIG